jgi:hypothetical protein
MAIVVQDLPLESFKVLPGVNPPTQQLEYTQSAGVIANQFPFNTLVFPDSVLSGAFWTVSTGVVGTTPAISIAIDWLLASGSVTAANVRWGVQIGVIGSASAGVLNIYTKSLATAVNANGAVPATAFATVRTAIAGGTDGGLLAAANGPFDIAVKVFRDGTDTTNDTAIGDVKVRKVSVLYQDT